MCVSVFLNSISFEIAEGCVDNCGGTTKGQCIFEEGQWFCRCEDGWGGLDCKTPQETSCLDDKDNDKGNVLLFDKYNFKLI